MRMAWMAALALQTALFTGCKDQWNDHYETSPAETANGSLWESLAGNADLSNFASVVQACGYDRTLSSNQTFTVFAPTNSSFSAEEAKSLIDSYQSQAAKGVRMNDNTVIRRFVQNHIAQYRHPVSSFTEETITLMNNKYAHITADRIDNRMLLSKNSLNANGLLFTLDGKMDYTPNVFESLEMEEQLDSVFGFLNSHSVYLFDESQSVPGEIIDGETHYLDSVTVFQNDLLNLLGLINSEDSAYIMVAPVNSEWDRLVAEYEPYFNYANNVPKRDSLIYTNTRMAIMKGTAFSRTINTDKMLQDSAMSTNAVMYYTSRRYTWGADSLHYFQYFNPMQAGGVLTGSTNVECSNGMILKSNNWPFDKRETFFQTRIIEAESQGAIQDVSKVERVQGSDTIQAETITPQIRYVVSNNAFYNKVSNNGFVEFEPSVTTVNHSVTFNITNVLSNIGYDIYLVTAPALANDSNATEIQRLPTIVRCTLGFHNQQGAGQTDQVVSSYTTNPDIVDYIKIAEDYKFPVCSYGLEEENAQVTLKVETRVSSTQQRNNTHTRTMRIDCIILKPHEE